MNRIVGGVILFLTMLGSPVCIAGATDGYRLLNLDGHEVKWEEPVPGTGATISYAVAATTPSTMGTRNCTNVSSISPLLKHTPLSRQEFMAALHDALSMWEQIADVRFTPAKDQAHADVLITAEVVPDGIAYTDLTTKASGQERPEAITHGIVCLNPQLAWLASSTRGDGSYNLTAGLGHEIGHILGLDHPGPNGEMMSFEYDPKITHLQAGDIAGIERLYGRKRPIINAAIGAALLHPE